MAPGCAEPEPAAAARAGAGPHSATDPDSVRAELSWGGTVSGAGARSALGREMGEQARGHATPGYRHATGNVGIVPCIVSMFAVTWVNNLK